MTTEDLLKRIERLEMTLYGKCDNHWHETKALSDGAVIGTIGSMTHLIDPETKMPISSGFHEIKVIVPCHRYEGTIGSKKTTFCVDRKF